MLFPKMYSIAGTFNEGFKKLGHDVFEFDYREKVKNWENKIDIQIFRLPYSSRKKWRNYFMKRIIVIVAVIAFLVILFGCEPTLYKNASDYCKKNDNFNMTHGECVRWAKDQAYDKVVEYCKAYYDDLEFKNVGQCVSHYMQEVK